MGNSNKITDCSNAHLMDSFDGYSSADAETYVAAGQATAQLASSLLASKQPKSQLQQDVKAVCGRKPLLNIGGKKDKYLKCAADYAKGQQVSSTPSSTPSYMPPPSDSEGKFLGMPKVVGIAVVVGVFALVGFVVYKKMNPAIAPVAAIA